MASPLPARARLRGRSASAGENQCSCAEIRDGPRRQRAARRFDGNDGRNLAQEGASRITSMEIDTSSRRRTRSADCQGSEASQPPTFFALISSGQATNRGSKTTTDDRSVGRFCRRVRARETLLTDGRPTRWRGGSAIPIGPRSSQMSTGPPELDRLPRCVSPAHQTDPSARLGEQSDRCGYVIARDDESTVAPPGLFTKGNMGEPLTIASSRLLCL